MNKKNRALYRFTGVLFLLTGLLCTYIIGNEGSQAPWYPYFVAPICFVVACIYFDTVTKSFKHRIEWKYRKKDVIQGDKVEIITFQFDERNVKYN